MSRNPRQPALATAEITKELSGLEGVGLGPELADFGSDLTHRIEDSSAIGETVTPEMLVGTACSAVRDLASTAQRLPASQQTGESGAADDPLKLLSGLPAIAKVVFPYEFALGVKHRVDEVIGEIDAPETENPGFNADPITNKIKTMDQFSESVLGNAKDLVLGMDWIYFGVTRSEVTESFLDEAIPEILAGKEERMRTGVDIFSEGTAGARGRGGGYLATLNPKHRKPVEGKNPYWIGMTVEGISPAQATYARDNLLIKSPIVIAEFRKLDSKAVVRHLLAGREYRKLFAHVVRRRRSFIEGFHQH